MKKTIVVYGSSTGTCEELAGKIAAALGLDDSAVINVSELTPEMISENEALILALPPGDAANFRMTGTTG